MNNEISLYKHQNSMFIMSMNMLNLLSTCYIYNKKGLIISIPHSCLCGTSYLFWSNPRKNYIMYSDYLTVIFSIAYHFYNSFTYSKEVNTMYGILLLFYLYNISNYFKYLNKNEEYAVYFHSLTYLVGNIGIVYIYS